MSGPSLKEAAMNSAYRQRIRGCIAFLLETACCFVTTFAFAQQPQPTLQDELLDHHQGAWVLQGTIAGKQTTHDVTANWVLNHQYLSIHETSREKSAKGEPAYEAIVFVGWDAAASRYFAIWHDVWGGFGSASVGYAPHSGDEIRFLFKNSNGKDDFHTTFSYNRSADTWDWRMDNDDNGALKPFARVKLTRAQSQTQSSTPNQETAMTLHATGPFDVKISPQDDKLSDGISRMLLDKQYHGGLDGTSKGQMLATGSAKNSGVYVAIETFTGTLQTASGENGSVEKKTGSFALHHTGIMANGTPELDIRIVPGSGTGQLAGISGTMAITIGPDGKHSYDFEYTLPAQ
jgi:hypothetical protein